MIKVYAAVINKINLDSRHRKVYKIISLINIRKALKTHAVNKKCLSKSFGFQSIIFQTSNRYIFGYV